MGGPPPAGQLSVTGGEPRELIELAIALAHEAGELLLARYGECPRGVETKSTPTDLVSEADHAAEACIVGGLARERPQDAVVGEEGGASGGDRSGLRWLVDPLDGTVNYLYGLPQWSVSIACEDGDGTLVGIVHDPLRGETFTAARDAPALLGGDELTGSDTTDLATALVATGFAYDAELRAAQAEVVARLLPAARDIRRLGSAALDLSWTAGGRYDAYYERGLNPWDLAAGALVCERAGLELRELPAAAALPSGLLAAPAALADAIAPLVTA